VTEWFRGLAEVPGVSYTSDPSVDRSKLTGYDAVPRREHFVIDGKREESLWWGNGSASPAHLFSSQGLERPTRETLLRRLRETLELPGVASDYHFAIQSCVTELWKLRRDDPEIHAAVEDLCWLDIRLIEAQPQTISFERDGETLYYRVLAFGHLINLYEHEGSLREALDVAERAARFGQCEADVHRIAEEIRAVEAEDVG
jgi:hypothetical protein